MLNANGSQLRVSCLVLAGVLLLLCFSLENDVHAQENIQVPETDMDRPDDIAVVIGIKNYKNPDIPNVDYALRDARMMKRYLTRTLGFRKENVIFVENASGSALTRIFGSKSDHRGQIYNWVKPNESGVFVYYSGHGAPDPKTQEAYLVASNTDPDYLTLNGYPIEQIYKNLSKVPAQSVTVTLEACFSGISEGGAVVQNASPAVLSVESPVIGMKNGLSITAGAADQIASWYPGKRHGLFTYHFFKGLRGAADENGNHAITAKEMKAYLTDEGEGVAYWARRLHNREQTPQIIGQNMERVFVEYDDSRKLPSEVKRQSELSPNVSSAEANQSDTFSEVDEDEKASTTKTEEEKSISNSGSSQGTPKGSNDAGETGGGVSRVAQGGVTGGEGFRSGGLTDPGSAPDLSSIETDPIVELSQRHELPERGEDEELDTYLMRDDVRRRISELVIRFQQNKDNFTSQEQEALIQVTNEYDRLLPKEDPDSPK